MFAKIAHHLHPEIRKMLERDFVGTRIPCAIPVNYLLNIEIQIRYNDQFQFGLSKQQYIKSWYPDNEKMKR